MSGVNPDYSVLDELPYLTITLIQQNKPAAEPALWNSRYIEITQNFAKLLQIANARVRYDSGGAFLPVGDTSERGTSIIGKIRFNNETDEVEVVGVNSIWRDIGAPNASTTVAGKVALATSAEAQTGTNATKAVTPAALAARTATEARAGLVELATTAEATTGTDTARAVTPAGLKAAIDAGAVGAASTTVAGKVALATSAEAQTGTDATKAVTPAALAARTATEARAGLVELATTAEVTTGTDATRAITPKSLKDSRVAIGFGGVRYNVTSLRLAGVSYPNTYGYPIFVTISANFNTNQTLTVGGTSYTINDGTGGTNSFITFIVMNGESYSLSGWSDMYFIEEIR